MRIITRPRGREENVKNHPQSSNNYLQVNLRNSEGSACTELAYKVGYKGALGQLNVFFLALCKTPKQSSL